MDEDNFVHVFEPLVDARGGQKALAEQIGGVYSTVRSWFAQNRFPRDVAVEIARFCGREHTEDQLIALYPGTEFSRPMRPRRLATSAESLFERSLHDLDTACSRAYSNRSAQIESDIESLVRRLIASTCQEHFWVSTSLAREPHMLEPGHLASNTFDPDFLDAMAEGLLVGVIIPDASRLTSLTEDYGLTEVITLQLLRTRFESLRTRLLTRLRSDAHPDPEGGADRRLQLFEWHDFICTPCRSIVSLVGEAISPGNAPCRVLLREPATSGRGSLLNPYNPEQVATLHSFVKKVTSTEQQAIAAGRSSAGASRENQEAFYANRTRFITLLSRRMRGEEARAT